MSIVELIFDFVMNHFNEKVISEDLNYNYNNYLIDISNNNFNIDIDPFDYSFVGIKKYDFENKFKKLMKDVYTNFDFNCNEYFLNGKSIIKLTLFYYDEIINSDSDEEIINHDFFQMNENLLFS